METRAPFVVVGAFVLALVVEALLILVLLLFGPHFIPAPKPEGRATSFSMSPSPSTRRTVSLLVQKCLSAFYQFGTLVTQRVL